MTTTKSLHVMITQSSTNPPAQDKLFNELSLDDISWVRVSAGGYRGTLAGAFPYNSQKRTSVALDFNSDQNYDYSARAFREDDDNIFMVSHIGVTASDDVISFPSRLRIDVVSVD